MKTFTFRYDPKASLDGMFDSFKEVVRTHKSQIHSDEMRSNSVPTENSCLHGKTGYSSQKDWATACFWIVLNWPWPMTGWILEKEGKDGGWLTIPNRLAFEAPRMWSTSRLR